MRFLTHLMAAAVLIVAGAQVVRADPIRVGDGSAFVVTDFRSTPDRSFDNSGVFILPPDIVTGVFGREIFANARTGCQPCAPGDVLNLSGSWELRGPNYLSAGDDYAVYGIGTLNFHTPDAVVPVSDWMFAHMTTTFDFDGFVSLYRVPGDVLMFQGDVAGQGFTRLFLGSDGTLRTFHQQQYMFGPNRFDEAQVPEPASLVLLATGLALAAGRARRRC